MSKAPPPPVKNLPVLKVCGRYIYRTIGKRRGNIRDMLVAYCYADGISDAQAQRNARMFAAAPRLLEACRGALADDSICDDALRYELRSAIALAEGK